MIRTKIIYVSIVAIALALCAGAASAGESYTALVVKVSDGDTITVVNRDSDRVKIRLANIDAPEKKQPYGYEATQALSSLIHSKHVIISPTNTDRYNRTIATVWLGNQNINAAMVKGGMAWVYTRYNNNPELPVVQLEARSLKAGLWKDTNPMEPWKWRKAKTSRAGEGG